MVLTQLLAASLNDNILNISVFCFLFTVLDRRKTELESGVSQDFC